mgnify:CR=1 FL=1
MYFFSGGTISFEVPFGVSSYAFNYETCFVSGTSLPLINGYHVRGKGCKNGDGEVVVSELFVFEAKGGKKLFDYSRRIVNLEDDR